MRSRTSMLIITALTLGAALVLGTAARAGEPIHVGGRMTCKTPEQHQFRWRVIRVTFWLYKR